MLIRSTLIPNRIPRALPSWGQMLDSLGNPSAQEMAKLLHLSERTIYGYQRAGQAPYSVMLAVFWLTPWGDSALDCDRENLLRVLQSLTKSLENEAATLRVRVARLEATGDFGAANEPVQAPGSAPRRLAPGVMPYEGPNLQEQHLPAPAPRRFAAG